MSEVRFHKNGVVIIEDAQKVIHVLEPQDTIRDLAKYIWREESLKDLRIEGETSSLKNHEKVRFVKLSIEKDERLRSVHLDNDTYYQE